MSMVHENYATILFFLELSFHPLFALQHIVTVFFLMEIVIWVLPIKVIVLKLGLRSKVERDSNGIIKMVVNKNLCQTSIIVTKCMILDMVKDNGLSN